MNRQQRRAMRGKTFGAKCLMCEAEACEIHIIQHKGLRQPAICKGCPCSTERCEWCGHTGEHWLGCAAVGLPSEGGQEAIQ